LPYQYSKLEEHITTDVLIIGSGISGALSAHYLVKEGFNCVVVDERSIALGSTCASTSLLQYELDEPLHALKKKIGNYAANRVYDMCSQSIDTIEEICKTIGCGEFTRRPSLYYAAYKKDAQTIKDEYEARKQLGFKMELLSEKDIRDQFGFAAPNAILSQQGACLDAYSFTHALHQHGIKKGLKVYNRTSITDIEYKKKGVVAKTSGNFSIRAKKVVNATGYQVGHFIDQKIVTLHSTYAIVSEQLSSKAKTWSREAMIWNTADPYLYMRKTDDNRIIIGGRDEEFFSPAKRDRLLAKKSLQLEQDFFRLFPEVEFKPEFCWTGTFGITKDSLPYIGEHATTPHTYYALGFGGNGITFSVIAAQLIADAITGRKNADARLYTFER
ncbi:MAG: FAD-dependent oxidoreductase, partial [Bacteroidota bacterium]